MKHILIILAACAALAGCAGSLPMDPSKMSPEQLKAVKESSLSVQCTAGSGPWGKVQTTFITLDKGSVAAGTTSAETECGKVSVTVDPKVLAPAPPAKATP